MASRVHCGLHGTWWLKAITVSIPREFHRFLNDAKASLGEVRNQLMHAKDERSVDDDEFRELSSLANRAIGAANALQKYLRSGPSKFTQRPKSRAFHRF